MLHQHWDQGLLPCAPQTFVLYLLIRMYPNIQIWRGTDEQNSNFQILLICWKPYFRVLYLVTDALLGLEGGEEAARMCAAPTARIYASLPSFLPFVFLIPPAFLSAPRGPLRDIIRYMHKAERERTNQRMYERERGRPSVIQRGQGRGPWPPLPPLPPLQT